MNLSFPIVELTTFILKQEDFKLSKVTQIYSVWSSPLFSD